VRATSPGRTRRAAAACREFGTAKLPGRPRFCRVRLRLAPVTRPPPACARFVPVRVCRHDACLPLRKRPGSPFGFQHNGSDSKSQLDKRTISVRFISSLFRRAVWTIPISVYTQGVDHVIPGSSSVRGAPRRRKPPPFPCSAQARYCCAQTIHRPVHRKRTGRLSRCAYLWQRNDSVLFARNTGTLARSGHYHRDAERQVCCGAYCQQRNGCAAFM
jgi:hypothetical protein